MQLIPLYRKIKITIVNPNCVIDMQLQIFAIVSNMSNKSIKLT